jgi:positive regulator of sigma E activity
MTAENTVGAQVGDEVEIDMENVSFMTAMLIAYGFPLVALMVGIFGGYYGLLALGLSEGMSQGLASIIGLIALAISYAVIKYKEDSIKKMRKFKPVIVGIKTKDSI